MTKTDKINGIILTKRERRGCRLVPLAMPLKNQQRPPLGIAPRRSVPPLRFQSHTLLLHYCTAINTNKPTLGDVECQSSYAHLNWLVYSCTCIEHYSRISNPPSLEGTTNVRVHWCTVIRHATFRVDVHSRSRHARGLFRPHRFQCHALAAMSTSGRDFSLSPTSFHTDTVPPYAVQGFVATSTCPRRRNNKRVIEVAIDY